MALSMFSCSRGEESDSSASSGNFKLPYLSSDSTDPYACKSDVNSILNSLIYEGLFKISADRNIKKALAEKYTFQDKVITVNLKSTKFSDGSSLTADDVVHSFNRAKQSQRYKSDLSPISSAQKKGSSVVRFTLEGDDVYALNLLTFPIISQKNNYIGTGRYMIDKSKDTHYLVYNKNFEGAKPNIEKIELCECHDYANAVSLLNSGKIDYLFDTLENGNIRSATGKSQAGKMNNLIFMGLNAKKGVLKNSYFRLGIANAVNQKKIAGDAFKGYAFETSTPFDAQWSDMGSVVATPVLSDSAEAKSAFLKAGLEYDKMGVNLLKDGKQVTLNLIVNSANNMKIEAAEMIKTQLINFGISVEIQKMPLDEYNIAIENGNFDMYIGEVKIPNDFNLECFFTSGGGADFGINSPSLKKIYRSFRAGNSSLQDFVSAFCAQNPFVPLAYKGADVCASASLEGNIKATENNIYGGIEEWSF